MNPLRVYDPLQTSKGKTDAGNTNRSPENDSQTLAACPNAEAFTPGKQCNMCRASEAN